MDRLWVQETARSYTDSWPSLDPLLVPTYPKSPHHRSEIRVNRCETDRGRKTVRTESAALPPKPARNRKAINWSAFWAKQRPRFHAVDRGRVSETGSIPSRVNFGIVNTDRGTTYLPLEERETCIEFSIRKRHSDRGSST